MKISEAEKLICPFIRAVDRGGWNRLNGSPSHINCITDKCMAWETVQTQELHIDGVDAHGTQKVSVVRNLQREDCEGYCRRLR